MALAYSRHLQPEIIVYDCMDELSAFRNAPAELLAHEEELLHRADIVFTGGHSLYESKRHRHHAVHAFPSSIDKGHFGQARAVLPEPDDQAGMGSPRIGFAGVIDERMDLALLRGVAERRPDWHIVMIGPVVKIDKATLPRNPNIHYLGQKPYGSLPAYMSHWNAAILPFAHNESTRFISPTKTPEYLAAGLPVVSTSIRDVVRPYGALDLVRITDAVDGFVEALDLAITRDRTDAVRWARIDAYLSGLSWDRTWESMARLISRARLDRMNRRRHRTPVPPGQERRRVALVQNGYPSRFHDRREAAR
jgi:UDP-galactopyranose mutase